MLYVAGPPATVTGAGSDIELLDLTGVKAFIGVKGTGDDALIQVLMNGVYRAIHRMTGRVFPLSGTAFEYYLEGLRGSPHLVLPQWPITTVTSIELGYVSDATPTFTVTQTLTSTDYYIDHNAGMLRSFTGWTHGDNSVRVIWKAGYTDIPDDLISAACTWIGVVYQRGQDSRWDHTAKGFDVNAQSFIRAEIPETSKSIIENYKRLELTIG